MTEYNELEQAELVKSWWRKYGVATIFGIIIAIAIVVGWRYYKNYQVHHSIAAAAAYQTVLQTAGHDKKKATKDAEALIKDYKNTPYAVLTSLWLAKQSVEQNDLKAASQHLQWVINKQHKGAWHDLASVRLARIYIAQKQPRRALNLLTKLPKRSIYAALISQAQGDAYNALGRKTAAAQAYQKALSQLPDAAPERAIIQTKLANLPVQSKS
ncbi:MAG: tetratricopeptide repeat protein [Pseudomonadota bacterium]